jgi:hypothetical protein
MTFGARSDANKMFDESDVRSKKLVLVEQWRGVEKPLSPSSHILNIWTAWGSERGQASILTKTPFRRKKFSDLPIVISM